MTCFLNDCLLISTAREIIGGDTCLFMKKDEFSVGRGALRCDAGYPDRLNRGYRGLKFRVNVELDRCTKSAAAQLLCFEAWNIAHLASSSCLEVGIIL